MPSWPDQFPPLKTAYLQVAQLAVLHRERDEQRVAINALQARLLSSQASQAALHEHVLELERLLCQAASPLLCNPSAAAALTTPSAAAALALQHGVPNTNPAVSAQQKLALLAPTAPVPPLQQPHDSAAATMALSGAARGLVPRLAALHNGVAMAPAPGCPVASSSSAVQLGALGGPAPPLRPCQQPPAAPPPQLSQPSARPTQFSQPQPQPWWVSSQVQQQLAASGAAGPPSHPEATPGAVLSCAQPPSPAPAPDAAPSAPMPTTQPPNEGGATAGSLLAVQVPPATSQGLQQRNDSAHSVSSAGMSHPTSPLGQEALPSLPPANPAVQVPASASSASQPAASQPAVDQSSPTAANMLDLLCSVANSQQAPSRQAASHSTSVNDAEIGYLTPPSPGDASYHRLDVRGSPTVDPVKQPSAQVVGTDANSLLAQARAGVGAAGSLARIRQQSMAASASSALPLGGWTKRQRTLQ